MPIERTIILVKPDGVKNGWKEAIMDRYRASGLSVIAEATLRLSEPQARVFYAEHAGRFYFAGLLLAMTSGPVHAAILEGQHAIRLVRELNGATNPTEAAEGTIRRDFRSAGGPFNTVHSSDSPEAFTREWSALGLVVA